MGADADHRKTSHLRATRQSRAIVNSGSQEQAAEDRIASASAQGSRSERREPLKREQTQWQKENPAPPSTSASKRATTKPSARSLAWLTAWQDARLRNG